MDDYEDTLESQQEGTEQDELESGEVDQSGLEYMRDHMDTETLVSAFEAQGMELPDNDEALLSMLRTYPGTEAYDDETLLSMWNDTSEGVVDDAAQSTGEETEIPAFEPKGWTVQMDGNPVEDLSKVTALDLLRGGKFTYRALNQDQVRDFNEIVRNAQLGHFNEQRYLQMQSDAKVLSDQLIEAQREVEQFREYEQMWYAALQNPEYYQKLAEEYKNHLGTPPGEFEAPTAQSEAEMQLAGQQVFDNEIKPYLGQVADYYGIDQQSLDAYVINYLNNLPAALMTEDRVLNYLQRELIMDIESQGYSPQYDEAGNRIQEQQAQQSQNQQVQETLQQPQTNEEVEALKKELAQMKEVVKSLQTRQKVSKKKKAPPSGKGREAGVEDDNPLDKKDLTAADFKEFLRS